jgi:hypothetical protein
MTMLPTDTMTHRYKCHCFPAGTIAHAVWLYFHLIAVTHRRRLRSGFRGPDEPVDDVTVAPVDKGCDGVTTDIVDMPSDQRKVILGKIADRGQTRFVCAIPQPTTELSISAWEFYALAKNKT